MSRRVLCARLLTICNSSLNDKFLVYGKGFMKARWDVGAVKRMVCSWELAALLTAAGKVQQDVTAGVQPRASDLWEGDFFTSGLQPSNVPCLGRLAYDSMPYKLGKPWELDWLLCAAWPESLSFSHALSTASYADYFLWRQHVCWDSQRNAARWPGHMVCDC